MLAKIFLQEFTITFTCRQGFYPKTVEMSMVFLFENMRFPGNCFRNKKGKSHRCIVVYHRLAALFNFGPGIFPGSVSLHHDFQTSTLARPQRLFFIDPGDCQCAAYIASKPK